jgi:hypothetical protein
VAPPLLDSRDGLDIQDIRFGYLGYTDAAQVRWYELAGSAWPAA